MYMIQICLGVNVHGLGRVLRWKTGGRARVFSALLQEIWHVEDTVYGELFYFVKLKQVLSSLDCCLGFGYFKGNGETTFLDYRES